MSIGEVASYEGTFEDAVSDMTIPVPELMPFNEWISWRKKEGLRPTKKHGCARATTSLEEADLWRRAMQHFHGEDWRMTMETNLILVSGDVGLLEDQAPSQTLRPAGSAPSMSPVAEPAGSVLAAQGAGVGNYALSEGTHSERTSSTLSAPGTPRGLQKLLKKPYNPLEDTYERYAKRVNRLVAALGMHEIHTDEAMWGSMLWDAEITSQIHSFRDEQQVAWLKRAFAQIMMTEDSRGEEEREWRIEVVNKRLEERGYNSPARYVDKIAAGSPASYQGSPFKFDIKGVSLPPDFLRQSCPHTSPVNCTLAPLDVC